MFQCSGSEANDAAIKLAWYYHNVTGRPAKKKIIGRIRGYHGNTVATASLSGQPHMQADFDLPLGDRFLHIATRISTAPACRARPRNSSAPAWRPSCRR